MPLQMHPTSYGNPTVHGEMNTVHIGKYCSIANSVEFDGGLQHNTRFVTTFPLWKIGAEKVESGMCRGDIRVGHDVWIGDKAMIMSGVTIGDGAVIAARAVVTKDVVPYSVVGGIPAKHLRDRFLLSDVVRLLKVKWWDWPPEKIREFAPLMLSPDINTFLEKAES